MKKYGTAFLISLGLTLLVLILLQTRFGMTPATGPFFSPFEGFWQLAEGPADRTDQTVSLKGLNNEVSIHYDNNGIPHIFARNEEDLYKAQGYLVARERFWQMEFLALVAAGRLTEIIGEQALNYSRYMRNMGMVEGARQAEQNMMADQRSRRIVTAFTEGVNQYRNRLHPRRYPLEYKILGYEPEAWTPFKTALVHMYMSHTLTGRSDAFQMTNNLDQFGRDFFNRFYGRDNKPHEFFIPDEDQFDFETIQAAGPDSSFTPSVMSESPIQLPNPAIGSNNWAIHGDRTETGFPMLSNDMHLDLSLPSIWIEMQLHTPEYSTYGVNLPGTPGIIVGFNEALSWGFTNANSNVLDVYEIEFRNSSANEYLHDGEWLPVEQQEERYEFPDGSVVTDTLRFTHHGPVFETSDLHESFPSGHAIRWTAHQPGRELIAITDINRSGNLDDFRETISDFQVPGQNFVYADTSGNIGMFHQGRFPLRWEGQGDFISNGRDPAYDWHQRIPANQNPYVVNPQRGYLGSANQKPVGDYYPYYLGRTYATNERGTRIHEMLESETRADSTFMKTMIHDDLSVEARELVPGLLEWINRERLNEEQIHILETLADWDYRYDPDSRMPYFFTEWWHSMYDEIWNPVFEPSPKPLRKPSREQTRHELTRNPQDSIWFAGRFDNISELTTEVFRETYREITDAHGPPGAGWKWENRQNVNLNHMGQLPGMGRQNVAPGGTDLAINASRESWGPSWRMIVDLSPFGVKAWGTFPGGISGNPGSGRYDEFLDQWITGELRQLHYWKDETQAEPDYTLQLIPHSL